MSVQIVNKQRRRLRRVVKTALLGVGISGRSICVRVKTAGLINMAVVKIMQFLY